MKKIVFGSILTALLVVLFACGGGGATVNQSGSTSLSGTASVGAPLSGATVTAIDATGNILTTTADSNGAYSFSDISSLKAPILVTASGNVGGYAMSFSSVAVDISEGSNTISNATPMTDAIAYQASGVSTGTLASNPSLLSNISSSAIKNSSANVVTSVATVLNQLTANSANGFNPNSSVIVADGSNAYDKVNDLLGIFVTNISNSPVINIVDKSGQNGIISVGNGNASVMSALSSSSLQIPCGTLRQFLANMNDAMSTQANITGSTFANLIDPNLLFEGYNKTQFLSSITTSYSGSHSANSNFDLLGVTFTNPVIVSSDSNNYCLANLDFHNPSDGNSGPMQAYFLYNAQTNSWLFSGDHQQNITNGFTSFAQYSVSSNSIQVGISFSINSQTLALSANPYNSAVAYFQDANGNTDYTIYFVQKNQGSNNGPCPTTSSGYWGLPIANVANPAQNNSIDLVSGNACSTTVMYSDQSILNTINNHIKNGGYKLVVKAYSDYNWGATSGATETDITQNLTTPLLTTSQLSPSMFASVSTGVDSTGPYLKVNNPTDYTQVGNVSMSTSNSNYSWTSNGTGWAVKSVYRPSPAWPSGQTIGSFFLSFVNKYNQQLNVTN